MEYFIAILGLILFYISLAGVSGCFIGFMVGQYWNKKYLKSSSLLFGSIFGVLLLTIIVVSTVLDEGYWERTTSAETDDTNQQIQESYDSYMKDAEAQEEAIYNFMNDYLANVSQAVNTGDFSYIESLAQDQTLMKVYIEDTLKDLSRNEVQYQHNLYNIESIVKISDMSFEVNVYEEVKYQNENESLTEEYYNTYIVDWTDDGIYLVNTWDRG